MATLDGDPSCGSDRLGEPFVAEHPPQCPGESLLVPGGNGQCGLVVHSQLGDAADRRGDHRDSDRHGLHDRDGKTLGERREAKDVGVPEVAVDLARCKFAVVAHRVVDAESRHLGADLGLVGTRSDDIEGGGGPLSAQPRQRVEEDDVALLGREAGDDEDAWRFRYRPWRARGEHVEVDPAAHDMKPVPQERVGHAAQLGAREVGDADDERSGRRLEVETGVRLVDEILKAVNREAPGPLLTVAEVADLGGEPRNRGGRLTEVGVEVGDAVGPAVLHRERCVGEVHEASQGDRQIEARRAQGPDDQTEEGDRVADATRSVDRRSPIGPADLRYRVRLLSARDASEARSSGAGRFMAIGTISAPRRRISSISLVMNVVTTRGWCVIT